MTETSESSIGITGAEFYRLGFKIEASTDYTLPRMAPLTNSGYYQSYSIS
jgi:hypothetical protein